MGKYPVTQAQYEAVMGENPSYFKGGSLPVERVSWNSAIEFCERLSQFTGSSYRLPSEAEWEYACRARTTTPYYFGNVLSTADANFNSNSTVKVGTYPPNSFGLYDMHGNVWEWCLDVWHDNYKGAPSDGSSWMKEGDNNYLIIRGGSWLSSPRVCRSAFRYFYSPDSRDLDIGFRVVCSAPRT